MPDVHDALREVLFGKTEGEKSIGEAVVFDGAVNTNLLTDDDGHLYVVCGYNIILYSDNTYSPVHSGQRPIDDSYANIGIGYVFAGSSISDIPT